MLLNLDTSAVVIGASGGIGAALCEYLKERGVRVIPFSRSPRNGEAQIDITDEDSVRAAAATLDVKPDLVIVATGVLHGEGFAPEKAMRQLDPEAMTKVFIANTLGPTLVAKHFLPLMRKQETSVFAALSARVGSISDNRLGGWLSYRSSKAALNMALKTLAIEHARTHPKGAVIGLHPGTVNTALSEPFQRGVPEGKLFDPSFSAEQLVNVIQSVDAESSGKVFAWDGSEIAA